MQEYIDIRKGQKTALIDDFQRLTLLGEGRKRVRKQWYRNKGHADMYKTYASSLKLNKESEYTNEDLRRVTVAYLAVSEMCLSKVGHARIAWDRNGYAVHFERKGGWENIYRSEEK